MTDWNDDTNGDDSWLEASLEPMARQLDAEQYPGQAWPPAVERRVRAPTGRRDRWIAAGTAAVSAALVVAVIFGPGRRPVAPVPQPPGSPHELTGAPSMVAEQTEGPSLPCVFVVEDLDSYSIVDATSEVAFVSFATKYGLGAAWLVALLPSLPPPCAAPDDC